ncbi:unnamed protein product [Prunus armeniaca]
MAWHGFRSNSRIIGQESLKLQSGLFREAPASEHFEFRGQNFNEGAGKVFEIGHVLEGCLKTWQVLEGYLKQDSSKLSERVRSSGKHLPPAAGKRAQVDFNPFSPSLFEEALLPLLEGTFLCGFSSMILNFAPFLVYSKSPVGILASNVSAYNVGASKEGLALILWDSIFFDLLELLEGCQFPCEQNCWLNLA